MICNKTHAHTENMFCMVHTVIDSGTACVCNVCSLTCHCKPCCMALWHLLTCWQCSILISLQRLEMVSKYHISNGKSNFHWLQHSPNLQQQHQRMFLLPEFVCEAGCVSKYSVLSPAQVWLTGVGQHMHDQSLWTAIRCLSVGLH